MSAAFSGYAPPGPYTRTLYDQGLAELRGELRVPAYIGIAQEVKSVLNADIVRGSSATRDNRKVGEDLSYLANGTNREFTVSIFPIVTGAGSGTVSTNPNHIECYVDGLKVVVSRLDGTTGTFYTQTAPANGSTVTVNYYYKLTDTRVVNEDFSVQADGSNTTFYTAYAPIVDGTNSGTPTTTITDVIVKVNDSAVVVSEVNGVDGYVVLDAAPLTTDTVTCTYYYNKYRNTSDDLPYVNPVAFSSVGLSPNSNDFVEGLDYVIINNQIHWGTTYVIQSGDNSAGSELFDDTQISFTLTDHRVYKEDVSSQFTGTESFFTVAHYPIVDGTGSDTVSERPSDVTVYVNSVAVDVTRIDGDTGKVYIKSVPLVTDIVEVTYYRNKLTDETYSFECKVEGIAGTGEYSVLDSSGNAVFNAEVGTVVGAVPVWNRLPATALNLSVTEDVTLTFLTATTFSVTSTNASGTGSGTTTSGSIGTTFIDDATGLNFTLDSSTTAAPGNTIVIEVNDTVSVPVVTSSTDYKYFIPGGKVIVSNTTNVAVGDTSVLTTYDKSGDEPSVGDVYYVSYTYEKVDADYEPKLFTKLRDVVAEYGEVSVQNHLSLAAFLGFSNGCSGVICKQVVRQTGLETAADASFITALDDLTRPISGVSPSVVVPLTTSLSVHQATKTHCNIYSSERYRSERTHIFGFATGTETQDAIAAAQGFANERSWCVYPDGAIIGLIDAFGVEREYIVDGSFMAAALAGLNTSQAYDEATPMTRKTVVGFKRLVRELTEVEKDQVATAGVIIFDFVPGAIRVRDSLTTDLSNPFAKRPEIVTIKDRVQRSMRSALDGFIGNKILKGTRRDIESRVAATLRGLVERNIISEYDSNILVEQDANDPSYFKVTCFYVPIFGLAYIRVTFNIRSQL